MLHDHLRDRRGALQRKLTGAWDTFGLSSRTACRFQSTTRALCGSGQQHPFLAPQRVQRIAFEIVSGGVRMSSLMPLGELARIAAASKTAAGRLSG
jgi:hypothetical protein